MPVHELLISEPAGTEPSPQTYPTASSHLQAPLSHGGMSRFGLDTASVHSGDSGFFGLGRPEPVSNYETNMDPDDLSEPHCVLLAVAAAASESCHLLPA